MGEGGSILHADHPRKWVIFARRFTVKRVLFDNAHRVVPLAAITKWAPFMVVLRERGMPLAVHADLGNDDAPTQSLPWSEAVLHRYSNNPIV